MGAILKLIGFTGLVGFLLKSGAGSYLDKIKVGFKKLSKENLSLFKSQIKLTLVVTNNNAFRIFVDDFIGQANFGKMSFDVNMKKTKSNDGVYVLESSQSIAFAFSVGVSNSDFFLQLSEQVESKEIPSLKIKGELIGGLSKDQLFSLPVNQSIQIL